MTSRRSLLSTVGWLIMMAGCGRSGLEGRDAAPSSADSVHDGARSQLESGITSSPADGGVDERPSSIVPATARWAPLTGRSINEILVRGDEVWFAFSMPCTDCPASPIRSDTPLSHGLAVSLASGEMRLFFANGENGYRSLRMDGQGKLYAAVFGPDVAPGIVALDPLLTDGASLADLQSFCSGTIEEFVVDGDGTFWARTFSLGLYECEGASKIVHDASRPDPISTTLFGMALDSDGSKWIGLGVGPDEPPGLLRINGPLWQFIPLTSIPELQALQEVSPECVDKKGNLWLSGSLAFLSDPGQPNLVRYSGSWATEGRGSVACDSRGVPWRFGANDLAYFDNGWHAVDVALPANRTGPVDVYQRTLLIGTASGLASFEDVIPAA
jgi:hypothetical protein